MTGYSIKIMRQDHIPCYLAASRALQEKDVQYPDVYYVELGNVRYFFSLFFFFSFGFSFGFSFSCFSFFYSFFLFSFFSSLSQSPDSPTFFFI